MSTFDIKKIVISIGGGILADFDDFFIGLFKSTIIHSIGNGINSKILILLPARAHSEHEASREQAFHVDGPSLYCNQRGQRSLSSSLSVLGQRRRQRRPDSQLVLPPWSVVRGSSSRGISNARLFLPALFFLALFPLPHPLGPTLWVKCPVLFSLIASGDYLLC